MNTSPVWQDQLLATKFFVPALSHTVVSRSRLLDLLDTGLQYRLTLLSAPAGFGKTTLLSDWIQSRQLGSSSFAWVSLNEGDNDPMSFWTYVLTSLDACNPGSGSQALARLRAPQPSPIESILTMLINAMVVMNKSAILVLDDYHLITEPSIHESLTFLLEHQPPQLHIFILTRVEPPLHIGRLRARSQVLEVRTDQLRFTSAESLTFLKEVMGLSLKEEKVQQVESRTEGWIAGLQLAALSLRGLSDASNMFSELRGSHRYILDYLIEDVLRQQPVAVQTFLLHTSILERLSEPLCDAVMQQNGSQEVLEELERSNLFIVSLDEVRHWYRYHTLFAEALYFQLEQMPGENIQLLHLRAMQWYTEQGYIKDAVHHALLAHAWQQAADLIESSTNPTSLLWRKRETWTMQRWLQQLPVEVVRTRPRLSLAYARSLRLMAPPDEVELWLQATEAMLTISSPPSASLQDNEREKMLGETLALRALAAGKYGDSNAATNLCRQALPHLKDQDFYEHALVAYAQALAYFASGQAAAATKYALESGTFYKAAGMTELAMSYKSLAAVPMHMQGYLHEAWQTCQEVIQLRNESEKYPSAAVGLAYAQQASILEEWNQLDAALALSLQGLQLGSQPGYEVFLPLIRSALVHVYLARGDIDAAYEIQQQNVHDPVITNNPYNYAWLASVEQVQLWLFRGELDEATRWGEQIIHGQRQISSFAREREDVAYIRLLLAQERPDEALTLLMPRVDDAQADERWDYVIEMRILQALAYQMHKQTQEALVTLAHAVALAQPEGYIRRFVNEGPAVEALLSQLRVQERRQGLTPYLDTLLAAFPSEAQKHVPISTDKTSHHVGITERVVPQPLLDPLSARELDVLRLLATGASNQEIAQDLVIALTTVKHHVSIILSKLGVSNRTQALVRARTLGLLSEEI